MSSGCSFLEKFQGSSPVQCDTQSQNCKTIAGTVAAVVSGVALTALGALAYVKGYLNPVFKFASVLIQPALSFATKSPLNTVALVVGAVAIISAVIFFGTLAKNAIEAQCNKSAAAADEATAAAAEADAAARVAVDAAADEVGGCAH